MDLTNKQETAESVLLDGLKFPEGPCFDQKGNLWFVEIQGGCLSKWDGKSLMRYDVNGTPNGATIDQNGIVWFCDSGRGEIRTFNPADDSFKTVCSGLEDGGRLIKPNDLIFDQWGNLLFSDHADGRESPLSTMCVLPYGGSVAKVISDNKFFTNGLAFRKNGTTLIFSETYHQTLWSAEWDHKDLRLTDEKVFAKAGEGPWGPDGVAFDKNEHLYVSIFNEHMINIYDKNGRVVRTLMCTGSRPTSCAFDPQNRYGLVVTEAQRGELLVFKDEGPGLEVYYGKL